MFIDGDLLNNSVNTIERNERSPGVLANGRTEVSEMEINGKVIRVQHGQVVNADCCSDPRALCKKCWAAQPRDEVPIFNETSLEDSIRGLDEVAECCGRRKGECVCNRHTSEDGIPIDGPPSLERSIQNEKQRS